MKQLFNAAVICIVALSACTTPFKKAKDGSEYKVVSNKSGKLVGKGEFLEMNVTAKYKDSLLFSSMDDGMPQYGMFDTAAFPSPFKEAFKDLHVGDSVIIRMSTDSLIAKGQAASAPFIKKGQFIYQTYKVINVYTSKEQTDSAQKTHVAVAKAKATKKQLAAIEKQLLENKPQIDKDSKVIEEYLAKNNLKATKAKWGTYIVTQTEGTGDKIGSANVASVNYTGKTLDSNKVFDSNTDPKFKHLEPLDVNMSQLGGIALGWIDAIAELKKGSKATIYIPSSLGYGKGGNPQAGINPDAILVFDMNIVDVISEEVAMAKQQAMQQQQMQQQQMQQQQMQAQQKMMEEAQKAAPKK
jgi:FKBP-type peptidyl-prolyl cis-trans isomerase FkpA